MIPFARSKEHKKSLSYIILVLATLLAFACKQGPKEDTLDMEPVHDLDQVHQNISLDVHRVKVLEVLPSEKYVYLKVEEGDAQYWVATGASEVEEGAYYQYNEALIEKDFESEALNRTFETLYLVTQLTPAKDGDSMRESDLVNALTNPDATIGEASPVPENPGDLPEVEIGTLLADMDAFEGQWIRVSGSCIKVNPAIMGRNWVHLVSPEGERVVLTTQEDVTIGQRVQFAARVALDRDFGSGYSYPILLEQGQLLN